jgi:polar amino acid transport system substrate-binding protein
MTGICLFMLLVSLIPRTGVAELNDVIRVGGDRNYPPYEFINEEGEPDGYNTELTLAIAEVMGMNIEIQLGGWDAMRKQFEKGELDALQGIIFSTERSKKYDYSPPHAIIHQSIFARKGDAKITELAELKDREVIVQRGGIMHDYLLQNDVGARLILVDTHAAALRLLASGQHDYALVANLPGLYLGQELALSNILPVGKPFGAQHYGYAVVKNNEELLSQFSEGLAILKNTGRQQAIYDRWLGPLENAGLPWKKIGQAAAIVSGLLLLILGGIVIWNRMLTRQVSRRTEELKLQQQQLLQADKMTSLGILVSGVAHEINNPSSLLLLNLPVLKEAYQDIEEIIEAHYQTHGDFDMGGLTYSRMRTEIAPMLDDMLTGTHRIRRIVDDLRDFARQSPADLTETVGINEVLATAIRLVDNTIRSSSDHFKVSYGNQLPPFRGNAQRIEQVIINLIVNACQSLESSEQSISIKTRYRPKENMLHLIIKDQGCGIEPDNLNRLSDPFFTTKREQGGTGLGLSVSASIVQEHGGSMLYESALGKGTSVTLLLPVTPGAV